MNADAALDRARALDRLPAEQRGPLHGLPIGVKDLLDTVDLPTTYGSPIYAGHRPAADAAGVALARAAGAVVLGKTVTTEFAVYTPGKTTNPHNAAHTPGGSSSGSAAAVADGMAPLAFGTQTGGSVIRPAAFCGVVGYKPTFGWIPRAGVKPLAESLDTVGCFARTVDDAARFAAVLAGRPELTPDAGQVSPTPPRLGCCRTGQWAHAEPATRALFEETLGALAGAREVRLPAELTGLVEAQVDIMGYEAARALAAERLQSAERLSPKLAAWLDTGLRVPPARYDEAMLAAGRGRRALAPWFDELELDALLVPSTPGEAPAGLETTGDAIFNRLWTLLHAPCVHLPFARGPRGLPLGLQAVAPAGRDAGLLRACRWLETKLGPPRETTRA